MDQSVDGAGATCVMCGRRIWAAAAVDEPVVHELAAGGIRVETQVLAP